MKQDQERVKNLLVQTVSMLCRNGLQYDAQLKIEGLLGITLDEQDVFLININEIFSAGSRPVASMPDMLGGLGVQLPHGQFSQTIGSMKGNASHRSPPSASFRRSQQLLKKMKQKPMSAMRRLKQRRHAALQEVMLQQGLQPPQTMSDDDEDEEFWDEINPAFHNQEQMAQFYQQPLVPMNDMTRYQNEVIDLIDDDEEDGDAIEDESIPNQGSLEKVSAATSISPKKRTRAKARQKAQKRSAESNVESLKKSRKEAVTSDQNGAEESENEHILEEVDEEEKLELDLELSLENLLGKYMSGQGDAGSEDNESTTTKSSLTSTSAKDQGKGKKSKAKPKLTTGQDKEENHSDNESDNQESLQKSNKNTEHQEIPSTSSKETLDTDCASQDNSEKLKTNQAYESHQTVDNVDCEKDIGNEDDCEPQRENVAEKEEGAGSVEDELLNYGSGDELAEAEEQVEDETEMLEGAT